MISEIATRQITQSAFHHGPQGLGKDVIQSARGPDRPGTSLRSKGPIGSTGAENAAHADNDEILQAFKEEFDLINNVELKFNKDQETGQTYIKIVDKDSGKIIREIPPEEVRKLAEKLDEMVGVLFDKKV